MTVMLRVDGRSGATKVQVAEQGDGRDHILARAGHGAVLGRPAVLVSEARCGRRMEGA